MIERMITAKECYHKGMLPPWNVTSIECYHHGMLPVWNVTSIECYHQGMLPPWNVTSMECYQYGMLPVWNVTSMECYHQIYGIALATTQRSEAMPARRMRYEYDFGRHVAWRCWVGTR